MVATYPTFKPDDMKMTVDVWSTLLADYEYKDIMMALQAYITTEPSAFAPSVGQLINKLQKLTTPNTMSDIEAWDIVRKAIADSTYHSEQRFNEFPAVIKKAVGSPNQLRAWAMDSNYNESVAQSNFLRSYRAERDRQTEFERLPQGIQAIVSKTLSAIEVKE